MAYDENAALAETRELTRSVAAEREAERHATRLGWLMLGPVLAAAASGAWSLMLLAKQTGGNWSEDLRRNVVILLIASALLWVGVLAWLAWRAAQRAAEADFLSVWRTRLRSDQEWELSDKVMERKRHKIRIDQLAALKVSLYRSTAVRFVCGLMLALGIFVEVSKESLSFALLVAFGAAFLLAEAALLIFVARAVQLGARFEDSARSAGLPLQAESQ